jgi:hypothetical protein
VAARFAEGHGRGKEEEAFIAQDEQTSLRQRAAGGKDGAAGPGQERNVCCGHFFFVSLRALRGLNDVDDRRIIR